MGIMDTIESGCKIAPRRTLLYGTHGIGKSTFGSLAKNPVFIQTEDGLNGIDCAKFPLSHSFDSVMKILGGLYVEDHDYKTVVIDSLDWLETLIWLKVCEDEGKINIEKIGYAKGYSFALTYWGQMIAALTDLRDKKEMSIILICHQRVERFENPETDPYDRYTPKIHKHASGLIQEWCDEVLFATYKVYTTTTEGDYGKKRITPAGGKERFIKTVESPTCIAKNRLGMPEEIPFTYADYAAYINKTNNGGN